MKLTPAQTKALETVSAGQAVAYLRGSQVAGYAKINGNTETKLKSLGLIQERATGVRVSYARGTSVEVTVWELTEAGREALGLEAPAEEQAEVEEEQEEEQEGEQAEEAQEQAPAPRPATPQAVGTALSRAGFTSRRGTTWAHGFKVSAAHRRGLVAVEAFFGRAEREREALAEYRKALEARGFAVEGEGTTIFVSRK